MADDNSGWSNRVLWIERTALALAIGAYLYFLQSDFPNGDGRVYMRQLEAGHLIWNPNHLYMEPLGLWFYRFTQTIGLGWTIFGCLKFLSGVSATLTAVLFHMVLSRVGIHPAAIRLLGSTGLIFSAHFLSMAIAEEFYMIQMPVLVGILLLAVCRSRDEIDSPTDRFRLATMGVLAALATIISINNAILAVMLGVFVTRGTDEHPQSDPRRAVWVWGAGMLAGLPLLLWPYLTTSADVGLIRWLTSYGGSENAADALYGIKWSLGGVAVSLATLAYGFATSLLLLGELGPVAEGFLRSRPLEFRPHTTHVAFTLILFVAIGVMTLTLTLWIIREGRRRYVGLLGVFWIGAYLVFNFLFVDTSDQFWMQILPAFWMLLTVFVMGTGKLDRNLVREIVLLSVIVLFLTIVNTTAVVAPRALTRVDENRAAFLDLLESGDLLITTGWDDLTWMSWADGQPYDRVLLMDLALRSRKSDDSMLRLPERIRAHLSSGRRVIVARLFDLDRESRPWEQLEKLNWPRSRLLTLFEGLDSRVLGEVDEVVFREVSLRPPAHSGTPKETLPAGPPPR